MSRIILHIILIVLACVPAYGRVRDKQAAHDKPFTVVIDPGHGGKDIGCRGKLTNEKTIVLDVAKRLGDILAKEAPDVKTIFTRSDDRFIALNERAAIANRADADLFISIHVNSVDAKTRGRENIHGVSVYTLGLHRNEDNLAVAMRENSAIELEEDFSETYQGFDPNSSESYIIFELTQNRHQQNSIEFADAATRELVKTAGRADKGVRQAGFLVLRATSMAAVLIELDFICNPAAERFLASAEGRQKCARSIANAFIQYYKRHKQPDTVAASAVKAEPREFYTVHLLSADKPVDAADARFKGHTDVANILDENTYIYYIGEHKTLNAAKKALRRLKKTFPDAFIIKIRDGKRVAQ